MNKYRALFTLMAVVMLLLSCMKDISDSLNGYTVSKDSNKNNDKDPLDVSAGITNKDWVGYLEYQKENGSSWKDMERTKVAIRFNKSENKPLSGTGYQLEYNDDGSIKDKNTFRWAITSDRIDIDYALWTDVFIEFNNDVCVINSNKFSGEMYDGNKYRYQFDLSRVMAIDWSQYFK